LDIISCIKYSICDLTYNIISYYAESCSMGKIKFKW